MPAFLHSPYARQKPSAGSQIDWSHPLARGLVGAWVCNERGGVPFDLVSKNRTVLTSYQFDGQGLISTASSGHIDTGSAYDTDIHVSSGAVVWGITPNFSLDATERFQWGNRFDSGNVFQAEIFTDNKWYVGSIGGGTDRRIAVAAAGSLVQGVAQIYAFTWGQSGSNFYVNGRLFGSNATVIVWPGAMGQNFYWGALSNSALSGLAAGSRFDFGYLYSRRVLTGADVGFLNAEPFSMLRGPDVWRRYFAVGGSTQLQAPRSMHQFRQRVA